MMAPEKFNFKKDWDSENFFKKLKLLIRGVPPLRPLPLLAFPNQKTYCS
jgi:hypothetical protein